MADFSDRALLTELYNALDSKWGGESLKRRQNALSPRIEIALENARVAIGAFQPDVAREAVADAKRALQL